MRITETELCYQQLVRDVDELRQRLI